MNNHIYTNQEKGNGCWAALVANPTALFRSVQIMQSRADVYGALSQGGFYRCDKFLMKRH